MTLLEAQTHPEYQALLRRVLEYPGDDAPRLIIADWLEENGQEERAKFIRWQVKNNDATFFQDDGFSEILIKLPRCVEESIINRGFIREIRLNSAEFLGGWCETCVGVGESRVEFPGAGHVRNPLVFDCETCQGTGFIEGAARKLFETHPITSVTFTDKRPTESFMFWHWNSEDISRGEAFLQKEIFFLLKGKSDRSPITGYYTYDYSTEAAALAAVCDAAVSYGRELVGLPPIP